MEFPTPEFPKNFRWAGRTLSADDLQAVSARFAPRIVSPEGGCWEWTGHRDPRGYGKIQIKHSGSLVHRLADWLGRGPRPEEQAVDHRCDNCAGVRPDHWERVTPAENTRRADAWQRPRDRKPVQCSVCGRKFLPRQGGAKMVCGLACRQTAATARRDRQRERQAERSRTCQRCATPFIPRKRRQRFCSGNCGRRGRSRTPGYCEVCGARFERYAATRFRSRRRTCSGACEQVLYRRHAAAYWTPENREAARRRGLAAQGRRD